MTISEKTSQVRVIYSLGLNDRDLPLILKLQEFFGGMSYFFTYLCSLVHHQHINTAMPGIPYAEPPLGSLRLQPTVLKTHLSSSVFNTTSFGLSCLQSNNSLIAPGSGISEDCLTINIFRPKGTTNSSLLPVLFW